KVVVDGFGEEWPDITGGVQINWSAVARDATDNFADCRIIGGLSGRAAGYTGTATKEPGEPDHAGNGGGKSIWWEFSAPTDILGGLGDEITF
ncbi:hypothetical protein, partial [Klebsiella variicola]|uniref:hypothetical protein n=1 Tax=Klebsiella variicola TaxID=244366 RepID=UPI002730C4B8